MEIADVTCCEIKMFHLFFGEGSYVSFCADWSVSLVRYGLAAVKDLTWMKVENLVVLVLRFVSGD